MSGLQRQIADLEAEIENLEEAAERIRKTMAAARAAIAAGGLLLLAIMVGMFRTEPVALLVAITALLGGVAFLGSSRSSLDENTAALQARRAQRDALIDGLDLLPAGS